MQTHQWRERRRLRLSGLAWSRSPRPTGTRDATTGLMNRAAFVAVGAYALRRSGRLHEPCGLVSVALVAPGEGDRPFDVGQLRLAVRMMSGETRAEDVLARTAPLELSALLPGAGEDDARSVAKRLEDVFGLAAAISTAVPPPPQLSAIVNGEERTTATGPGREDAVLRAEVGWTVVRPEPDATGRTVHELLCLARSTRPVAHSS